MKTTSITLFLLLFNLNQWAFADQSVDIYNGIMAETKIKDTSLSVGRQGRAMLFASSVEMLTQLVKNGFSGKFEPMIFSLKENKELGTTQFTGTSQVRYMNGPVCTKAVLTVIGAFPTGDTSNLNFFVDSVHVEVLASEMCV